MIYHILDEPFSAHTGLGVATVVANIMQFDVSSVVVCPEGDDSRGIPIDRIVIIPMLKVIAMRLGWHCLPSFIRRAIICRVFEPVTSQLNDDDIVWSHNWPYVAWALEPEARSKGAKVIYHAHNSIAPFANRSVFRVFRPDGIVFNSEAMRQEALAVMPFLSSTHTVHNGADESLFYPAAGPLSHRIPVVLYVGRLVHAKGVHVLIAAVKILNERKINLLCRIVGSSHAGGHRSKTTSYVEALHRDCPSNVQFEGFRSGIGVAEVYRQADILCCPSIWQEPFGNVNIEAMACGVPVVASRVGGIPEIASEGGILLVEPEAVVELADALQKLILDAELRAKVGAEGLASFRRGFTWPAIARQHREIAESLKGPFQPQPNLRSGMVKR